MVPVATGPVLSTESSFASPMPNDLNSPAIPPEVRKLLLSMSFLNVEDNPNAIIDDISKVLHMRMFSKGDFIMRQGEVARAVFFIVKGTIEIINDDGEITFAELSSGAYFGEIGIMFNMKRTATVVAKTNCTLVVMTGDELKSVLKNYPAAEKSMQKAAHQRVTDLAKEYEVSGKPMSPELVEQLNAMNYQFVLYFKCRKITEDHRPRFRCNHFFRKPHQQLLHQHRHQLHRPVIADFPAKICLKIQKKMTIMKNYQLLNQHRWQ